MKCRLNNASAAKNDRVVPYNSVTLGSFGLVEPNFMMWVGTTDGAKDLGKARIRSATASQFIVGENSNVKWQNGAYLTIFRYVELQAIFPRLINDPANAENVIFYKDYDIAYTNQNSILGTYPCAGDHQALFKGERVYYTNSGTVNLLGDSLTHDWSFEGGTPSSSSLATPGFVTYPNTGHFVTRYTVSGSSGGVDTTYRYVSVYDRPYQGANPPIQGAQISGIRGSREEGGYKASVRAYSNISIDENSVVVIFSEDWYGTTKQSFGGNSPNNEKIFFVGHVLANSIRYSWNHSYVEFEVGSITEVMKEALGFSISVESKASPTTWYELLDMDCRRAIYHYLKWQTTALQIADFQFIGDDRKIQFFDADRTSMYDAIDNLMRNTLLGKVVSDRQGKVWMEVDARAYDNPTGSFSAVMEITKRDWLGEPSVQQEFSDKLSYYEAGGIAYSGVNTGTFSAILASAPGSAPSFRGAIEMPEGLALLGQTQLNQLVGNVFANANSRLPKISMDMAGNYRNLDIAPQETVHQTILSTDTIAGIPVDGLYIPNEMSWKYDQKNKILLPSIDFVNLVSGQPGDTVEMATSATDAGFDSGFSVPQLQIPPLPTLTVPPSLTQAISVILNNNTIPVYADFAVVRYESSGGFVQSVNRNVSIANSYIAPFISSQFIPQKTGKYWVSANIFSLGSGSGYENLRIEVNNVVIYSDSKRLDANGFSSTSISGLLVLNSLDVVKGKNNPDGSISSVSIFSLSLIRISD